MSREDFEPGDRVIHAASRVRGTVVRDDYGVCAPNEVPVRFDGESAYEGTDWRELRKLDVVN